MHQIPLTYSLLTFLDELEYTEAALSADTDAAPLAATFQDELAAWSPMFDKERGARRAVVRANAVVRVRNASLDDATNRFGAMASAVKLVERFFPVPRSEFIRRALSKQCDHTLNVIVPELTKLSPDHALRPFGDLLGKLATTAREALATRGAAAGANAVVAHEVDDWKHGVNKLRTTTYAELLKTAAAKGFSREWVEAFFRQADDRAPVEVPAPAPAAAPVAG